MDRVKILIGFIAAVFVIAFSVFIIASFAKPSLPDLSIKRANFSEQNNITNITKDDAIKAIRNSEMIMKKMSEDNFSINYVNDTLIEAKSALEKAELAEQILSNKGGLSYQVKSILASLNYSSYVFADKYARVLEITDKIATASEKAYLLRDSIRILELKAEDYRIQGVDVSGISLEIKDAKNAFEAERYDEAVSIVEKVGDDLEAKKEEMTTLNLILRSGEGFFADYWAWLIFILVLLVFISLIIWGRVEKSFLKTKIDNLRIEKNALDNLMRRAQTERFKENKISGLVYNVRMNKYKERINEINEMIPVLQEKLKFKR
jgi:hypothetical protein